MRIPAALFLAACLLAPGPAGSVDAPFGALNLKENFVFHRTDPHSRPKVLPAGIERAISASMKLSDCSAQFISRSGHALTALHCLMGSLAPMKVVADPEQSYALLEVQNQIPGEYRHPDDRMDVSVLVTGKGMIGHVTSKEHLSPAIIARFKELDLADFAVVKFDRLPESADCVPIRLDLPRYGEPLWSIGFPVKTYRGSGDSDGVLKFMTEGRASRLEDNTALDPQERDLLELTQSQPESIVTTLDLVPHMSGSMVIDARGRMVGMNVKVLAIESPGPGGPQHVLFREIGSNGRAIAMSAIYRQVAERLGGDSAREIFDCR